eukprot:10907900-Karenia_brevis.AAC.1
MAYAATVKRVDDQLKKVEADAKEKADKEEADKAPAVEGDPEVLLEKMVEDAVDARLKAVSYTHLTLPTICSV